MTWCKSRKLQCPRLWEQKREIIALLTAAVTYLGETFPANEATLFRRSAGAERAGAAASPWRVQAEGRQGWEKQPRKTPPCPLCSLLELSFPLYQGAAFNLFLLKKKKIPLRQVLSALPPLAFGYLLVSRHLLVGLHLPSNPRPLPRIFVHQCPHPQRCQGAVAGTARGSWGQASVLTSASC